MQQTVTVTAPRTVIHAVNSASAGFGADELCSDPHMQRQPEASGEQVVESARTHKPAASAQAKTRTAGLADRAPSTLPGLSR
jgi:hypothetical protein